jgi:hypothetical protein
MKREGEKNEIITTTVHNRIGIMRVIMLTMTYILKTK